MRIAISGEVLSPAAGWAARLAGWMPALRRRVARTSAVEVGPAPAEAAPADGQPAKHWWHSLRLIDWVTRESGGSDRLASTEYLAMMRLFLDR